MQDTTDGVGGLLAVWVDVPDSLKEDFDRWYLHEHLPERRDVPGVLSARLFEPVDGGEEHVALYELESIEALSSPEYEALRRKPDTELGKHIRANWKNQRRGVYTLRSACRKHDLRPTECPYVSAVRASVNAGYEQQMREWLDAEHRVRQLEVDGAEAYQGYEPTEDPFHFLNLWGLQRPDVAGSDAWKQARETPWRDRLAPARGETVGRLLQPVG